MTYTTLVRIRAEKFFIFTLLININDAISEPAITLIPKYYLSVTERYIT